MGDLGLIPGLRRSPGEGNSYPLQYSGLENPMDRLVHGATKSGAQLSDFHFHSQKNNQEFLLSIKISLHDPERSQDLL